MNLNGTMEGKKTNIPKAKITETKSKTPPKSIENRNSKNVKGSIPRNINQSSSKKPDNKVRKNKSRLQTNIPVTDGLMKSRSYEKGLKTENTAEKVLGKDEKTKSVRSKSASEKPQTHSKDKGPTLPVTEKVAPVTEKVAPVSKDADPEKELKHKTSSRVKTDDKITGKEFSQLLPFYEKELRKIEDAWLSTAYCSLSMRANLLQFMIQSFPNVEKSQFYTEDRKLFQRFDQVKISTKAEADNLIHLVKSLLMTRERTKDEYQNITNNDKDLKKKTEILQVPEKKAVPANEKSQNSDASKKKKNLSFMSFFTFGNKTNTPSLLKQPENISNVPPNAEELTENKQETIKLKTVQEDFEALKAKYWSENEIYEKKIKDLEFLLEEKITILKKEKEVKNQMLSCLGQYQRKRLSKAIGYEQLEYIIGPSSQTSDKRREELWLTAIKLILKGFFIQLKNLEIEKNKMLYQLQLNDLENFNDVAASIIQKDNFVQSIKQQMAYFKTAYEKKIKETRAQN